MLDRYNRNIDYLRISITDRCNLRCMYCMPDGIKQIPMHEILSYEEIESVVRAAVECGINKFKITGGEPLVRKGCISFIKRLKGIEGVSQVTLTTNGMLLSDAVSELKDAGIDGINVSLDTLQDELFEKITKYGNVNQVLQGIKDSCNAGIPTKINVVLQKDVNDGEWQDLLLLAKDDPVDVRFIELMPIGSGKTEKGISNIELQEKIENLYPDITVDTSVHGNGPANYMHIPGFQGSVGFIGAIHGKFCDSCNRIRISSTGKVKPCLCYRDTVDLKEILRKPDAESRNEELVQALKTAIYKKPAAHCFENENEITEKNRMIEIGG